MRGIVVVLYFFITMLPSFGQHGGVYPDQFSSYFFNTSLVNPAYIQKDGLSETVAQSKLRSGFYKDISTIAASVQKVFNTDKNQWHSGRLLFQNEKEGPYISTPRFYGNYAVRIGLGEKSGLLGGISLGFVNPNYHTPTKSISNTYLDGSLGLMYQSERVTLGFSSNQMFNSNSGNSNVRIRRYYNSLLNAQLIRRESITANTYFLWSYYTDLPSQLGGVISMLWNDWLEIGTGFKTRQGSVFITSVTLDKASIHPIKMGLLYNSAILYPANLLGESLEISLSYSY